MDPYLESPDWFPNLHDGLITFLIGDLMRRLPQPYYARSRQRVWLEYAQHPIEPDDVVLHPGRGPSSWRSEGGGAAVAEEVALDEPVAVAVDTSDAALDHEPFVEVRRRHGSEDRLVAAIEVLSPANKTRGNPGRDSYLDKQREVLAGQTHLIEIDLLRGGEHTTAVPHDLAVAKAGAFDYHVCVHRFDQPSIYYVYPIKLERRLPGILIPLLPGDPDASLSLQAVFDRAYDEGPYSRVVFYGEDPLIPPLKPEQLEWVKARLKPPG
jgi:hypothetical protein